MKILPITIIRVLGIKYSLPDSKDKTFAFINIEILSFPLEHSLDIKDLG
jgi:hypothetical protein